MGSCTKTQLGSVVYDGCRVSAAVVGPGERDAVREEAVGKGGGAEAPVVGLGVVLEVQCCLRGDGGRC